MLKLRTDQLHGMHCIVARVDEVVKNVRSRMRRVPETVRGCIHREVAMVVSCVELGVRAD